LDLVEKPQILALSNYIQSRILENYYLGAISARNDYGFKASITGFTICGMNIAAN